MSPIEIPAKIQLVEKRETRTSQKNHGRKSKEQLTGLSLLCRCASAPPFSNSHHFCRKKGTSHRNLQANSNRFLRSDVRKRTFTRAVKNCISSAVVLDVRYSNSHFDSLATTANCISQICCFDLQKQLALRLKYAVLPLLCQFTAGFSV